MISWLTFHYPTWQAEAGAAQKNAELATELEGEIRNRLLCHYSKATKWIRDTPSKFRFEQAVDDLIVPAPANTACDFHSEYSQYSLITVMNKLASVSGPSDKWALEAFQDVLLTYRYDFPNTEGNPKLAAICYNELMAKIWATKWSRPDKKVLPGTSDYKECPFTPLYVSWSKKFFSIDSDTGSDIDAYGNKSWDTVWPDDHLRILH